MDPTDTLSQLVFVYLRSCDGLYARGICWDLDLYSQRAIIAALACSLMLWRREVNSLKSRKSHDNCYVFSFQPFASSMIHHVTYLKIVSPLSVFRP